MKEFFKMIKRIVELGLPVAGGVVSASDLFDKDGVGEEHYRRADAKAETLVATIYRGNHESGGEQFAPILDGDLMFESPEDYRIKCESDMYPTYPGERLEVVWDRMAVNARARKAGAALVESVTRNTVQNVQIRA